MRMLVGCLALAAAVGAALPSAAGAPQGAQQPNVVILNPSGQGAAPAPAPQTPAASSPSAAQSVPSAAPAPAPATGTPAAAPQAPASAGTAPAAAAPALAPAQSEAQGQKTAAPPAGAPAATGEAGPAVQEPAAAPAPPPPPPEPTLVVDINLTTQRMSVSENGEMKYNWPVSSARYGYTTPTGTFQPTWMSKLWYSRQYDYAPMPNSIFFHGGTAIHGTGAIGMLGRPASHGCVRLAPGNAARLYKLVSKHGKTATRIVVHGKARQTPVVAERGEDPWYGSGRRYYAMPPGYYGYYGYGYRRPPRGYAWDEPYYAPRPRAYYGYGKPRRKAQRYAPYGGYGYGYGF